MKTRIAFAFLILASAAQAFAQAWPAKPITLVVGSAPGSAPDVYSRAIAEPMGKLLGTTVVVANTSFAPVFLSRSTNVSRFFSYSASGTWM